MRSIRHSLLDLPRRVEPMPQVPMKKNMSLSGYAQPTANFLVFYFVNLPFSKIDISIFLLPGNSKKIKVFDF